MPKILYSVPDYVISDARTFSSGAGWHPGNSKKNAYLKFGDASFTSTASSTDIVQQTTTESAGAASSSGPLGGSNSNDLLVDQMGFIDDARFRGDASDNGDNYADGQPQIATPPNESAVRSGFSGALNAAVSSSIPTYVGWRDHTDGHRLTTTRGDKIEIVGGNYKIVSLGRGTGVAAFEMSGGHIVAGDEAPGSPTSVSWRDCPTDPGQKGWKSVEQTVKGNTIERFHGTAREEFYGNKQISVTGAPDETVASAAAGTAAAGANLTASADGAEEYVGTKTIAGEAWPTKWDAEGGAPPKLQQPDIYESTWAKSMTSYTKVNGNVSDTTHTTGTTTEEATYGGKHSAKATYEGDFEGNNYVSAGSYREYWHCMGGPGLFEYVFGAKTEVHLGASTTVGLANRFELFVGFEQQMNLGASAELKVGATLEVKAGPSGEFKTESLKFWLAENEAGVTITKACANEAEAALNTVSNALSSAGNALSMGFLSLMIRMS